MPERDYSKGQIYTIRCRDDPALIYVGSTINTLSKRLGYHKSSSKTQPERLVYKTIAGNWGRFYIELYELHPCGTKNELERREGQITREIGTMNREIAGRTHKEHYQDNKEKKKEQYQDNKEIIKEKCRQYRQVNKEIIKEKCRQNYQENKDTLNERMRQYRLKNAEKINEKQRQRYALKKQAK